MIPYWLLFAYFALGAALAAPRPGGPGAFLEFPLRSGMFFLGGILIVVMIGFRYEVGGDWVNYLEDLARARYRDLDQVIFSGGDPGYSFLNWIVSGVGAGIWLVNLVCGVIFAWGLLRFASIQREPWLATLVAVPYLTIVVAMGYSRQGVAIGIVMAGLASRLRGGSLLRLAAYIIVAALFHKTSVVVFPLVALAATRGRLVNTIIVAAFAVLLYDLFLAGSVGYFTAAYIDVAYASEGAPVRVAMNVLAALIFLFNQRRLGFTDHEYLVWRNLAWTSLGLLALLLALESSTAVDRLALYLIPLQLAVLSRVPGSLLKLSLGRVIVLAYSAVVQFTWLNYATHSRHWIPYRIYQGSEWEAAANSEVARHRSAV